jgi:B12 binding domain/Radical SAM superfamily
MRKSNTLAKILLIQPPIRDFYLTRKRTIPYGLARIAAVLIQQGFEVEILDALATRKSRIVDLPPEMAYLGEYYGRADLSPFSLFHKFRHFGYSYEHISNLVRRSGAFLVGISSLFTPYSREALTTARLVKEALPECPVVLGGHHPTAFPEESLQNPAVDYVLRGEGEAALPKLAGRLLSGRNPLDVPGIACRDDSGNLCITPPAYMDDLDTYPLPAFHLIKHSFYSRANGAGAVVVASRGCPLKCSYCALGSDEAPPFRRRRVDSVLDEIDVAVRENGVRFIDFEDENLSFDKRWFTRLLEELRGRFKTLDIELRAMNGLLPSTLDAELVRLMGRAGFRTLNLSLGATSAGQLERFGRPDVRSAFDHALELARENEMAAVGYVIAAAPGQSAEDSVADLLYLARRRVLAGLSIYYPAPRSRDYALCRELGVLPGDFSLMRASALPVSHHTSRLQAVTLLRLARLLNFMKSILDDGESLPDPSPWDGETVQDVENRRRMGRLLLQGFLRDGRIRGVQPDGRVFFHRIDLQLSRLFLDGLKSTFLAGAGSPRHFS